MIYSKNNLGKKPNAGLDQLKTLLHSPKTEFFIRSWMVCRRQTPNSLGASNMWSSTRGSIYSDYPNHPDMLWPRMQKPPAEVPLPNKCSILKKKRYSFW